MSLTKDRGDARQHASTRCASWPTRPTAAPSSTPTISRQGLRQIVRDSSAYYLLGYTSTLAQPDGKFHKINVRVKRPGLQVRARPGYLALTRRGSRARDRDRRSRVRRAAVTEALGTLAVDAPSEARFAAGLGCRRARTARRRSASCGLRRRRCRALRSETPARVSLIAGGANSDLYYRGPSLAPGRVEFEVPPGPIDLEIAVEDADGEVLDRETRKMIVPSLGLGPDAEHARGVSRAHASRMAEARGRSGGGACHRARVPPHRSPAAPRRRAERRRNARSSPRAC